MKEKVTNMEIGHILKLQNILNSNSKPRFYTIIQIHSRTEKEKQTKELLYLIKCINKTPEHLHTNIFYNSCSLCHWIRVLVSHKEGYLCHKSSFS